MNVLVNEFALVDITVAEPDVDGIEPSNVTEDFEAEFLANLAHGTLPVAFTFADMALGKSPLAVTVDNHRKVDGPALAFKHQPSSRHFGAMSLTLAATFA